MNPTSSLKFLVTLLAFSFALVCILYAPYLAVFILAIVFGVIFEPVNRFLLQHMPRWLAAILTMILIAIIIAGPVALVVWQTIREAGAILGPLQSGFVGNESIALIQQKVNGIIPGLGFNIAELVKKGTGWIVSQSGTIVSSAITLGLMAFLSAIGLVYWFIDSERLRNAVVDASPLDKKDTDAILSALGKSIHGVIKGTLVVALAQGIVAGVGFAIFGIPNAVLWGGVTAICALVPTIGTAIVSIPMVIYLVLAGHIPNAIGMAIWAVFAIGLIDNLIGPKLMSRGGNVHPFFILISVLGGVELLGPIGLFAGPLAIALFVAVFETYRTRNNVKKMSPKQ